MKKILLIGTGGTVTAKIFKGLRKPGKMDEQEVLNLIPQLKKIARIKSLQLYRMDSSNMQPDHWVTIAKTIKENYSKFDGFVILHGTDTMHYSASALSFLIQNPKKPIVLTGSQIPANLLGSDGVQNIIDSVRVAAETNIHEIVIVFNRKILRGNRARKFREIEFDAYESIGAPPLGVIEYDIRVSKNKNLSSRKTKFFSNIEPNVTLLKIHPGFNPKIILNMTDLGIKGLVLEGYGPGNVPIHYKSLLPQIKSATKQNIPVCVSSQCSVGVSWMNIYECGQKAIDAGAIPTYDMIPETALTKLMWILGNYPKLTITKIKSLFLKNICGEITIKKYTNKVFWEYDV